MTGPGLSAPELALVRSALQRFPQVRQAILFGSRAKDTHRRDSDIDLVLIGVPDDLAVEGIADALEDLPLPYRFDVKAYETLQYAPLIDHINRVGVVIYQK